MLRDQVKININNLKIIIMIKDIEMIIGRKIRGLKNREIDNLNFESCRANFILNKDQLKNNWSYDEESNTLTVKNGNFNASILFDPFTLVMIGKNWTRAKLPILPVIEKVKKPVIEKVKKPAKIKRIPAPIKKRILAPPKKQHSILEIYGIFAA